MRRIRTPEDIYQNVLDKKTSKNEAFKLLESLMGESNDPKIRADVIEIIQKLSFASESAYQMVEKALISDESDMVRLNAAMALIGNFKIPEETPLFYALENEQSVYVLKNLLQYCSSSDNALCTKIRNLIYERISKFYNLCPDDARFVMDIDYLEYLKFKENFNEFARKLNLNEKQKQETLQENAKLSYKGLGRVVKSKDGFILGLRLHDFRVIPLSIQYLKKLEYLEIKHSDLRNLDRSFENLLNLKYLILSNNELDVVPDWIVAVVRKNGLGLKYFKKGVKFEEAGILGLVEILLNQALVMLEEHELFNPSLLHHFKINRNGNIIGVNITSDLNRIGVFPAKLCDLHQLRILNLPNQNIRKIPNCVSNMKYLEILDLSNNKIKELPEKLTDLKNLKHLKLDGNDLNAKKP